MIVALTSIFCFIFQFLTDLVVVAECDRLGGITSVRRRLPD